MLFKPESNIGRRYCEELGGIMPEAYTPICLRFAFIPSEECQRLLEQECHIPMYASLADGFSLSIETFGNANALTNPIIRLSSLLPPIFDLDINRGQLNDLALTLQDDLFYEGERSLLVEAPPPFLLQLID